MFLVSYQDRKSFCYDLKQIYQAINRSVAEQAFETFKNKWSPLVPLAVRVWENNIEEKSFCYDLKQIYQAINRSVAEQAFETFKNKWSPLVPLAVRVWENNIEEVYQLFNFPKEIRKMIYTTNS